jgi:putative nucleotidyltransferase with HDIG domain
MKIYRQKGKCMDRINNLIQNDSYKKFMQDIDAKEQDRIFCCHGIEHCLDVARIAYIQKLENNIDIQKDVIYAAALLHDIGRAASCKSSSEHHERSAAYSKDILAEAGYTAEEIDMIVEAIRYHNSDGLDMEGLPELIYKADKNSRLCFSCKAYDECYWKKEDKNKGVID